MTVTDDLWDGQQAGCFIDKCDIGGGRISVCIEDGLMGV